jgi:hypothetical protein
MTLVHEPVACAPLVGTPRQVRDLLGKSRASQVVAVPMERADARQAGALAQTLPSIVSFLESALRDQSEQNDLALKALVSALVPKTPPTPTLLKEAAMLARSRKAVLEGADWLTAARLAELAGLSATNPSAQPNKWKRQRLIFAIHHNGVDYFPGYGLDPKTHWRPRAALKSVLEVFGGGKDGWGLAYWFFSVNSFLGGKRPQDVLATDPARVIAAAQDEVESVAHA